jgi:hypothetical protein
MFQKKENRTPAFAGATFPALRLPFGKFGR